MTVIQAVAGIGQPADPNFKNVALLLKDNGTNGAQNNTFLDSSSNNFTITRNGDTTQGAFTPYMPNGYWSNYFDGSGDYLTNSSSLVISASQDFTFEAWVNAATFTNSAQGRCVFCIGSETTSRVQFTLDTGGYARIEVFGGTVNVIANDIAMALNTWNHVAWVRQSNTIRIYVNGVASASTASSSLQLGNANGIIIGFRAGAAGFNSDFNGYISNLRLIRGTAVYTTNFTPPTAPLTAITNTSLLTCQSNRFVDNSSNAFALTATGTPRVTAFQPFPRTAIYSPTAYGGSAYFDGTGDYLTVASNSAFDISTGDFTAECWFYSNIAQSSFQRILTLNHGSTASNETIAFEVSASGVYMVAFSGVTNYPAATATSITSGVWYHLALVRNGNTFTAYVNGTATATATAAVTLNYSAGNTFFSTGGWPQSGSYTRFINGYVSNIRIVKGTALYTANFTPPASPVTNITNTSLLCNFTNAGIFDATTINDLQTAGNAQVSTTQAKWGATSLYFDGTGDWLFVANRPEQQLRTGNFTIETWVYLGATGVAQGFVGKGTATTGWLLSVNSSNQLVFTYASSTITSTGTLAGSTWYHVAVVREGTGTNQTKLYIGGSNDGTGTVNTDFNQTNAMYVAADRTGGSNLNGYLQDLRITPGIARYTANFTPPVAPFPPR